MAQSANDPYAGWRASLRDTLKWYVAALSGFGAVLASGLTFAILPDLQGQFLTMGVLLGLVTIGLVLAAIWLVQSLLFQRPFGRERVFETGIADNIRDALPTLLPGDIGDIHDLDRRLAEQEALRNPDLAELARLEGLRQKVTSYAAAVDLQDRVAFANRVLLVLFFLTLVSVGGLTHLRSLAGKADTQTKVALSLTGGWAGYLSALAAACPMPYPDALTGTGQQGTPFDGWWTVTLTGAPCEGVILSVPARMVLSPE